MTAFQTMNDVSQSRENSFSISLDGCQQSTLWIGNTEETPISSIAIHEIGEKFVIKVRIYDTHLIKFNLQITPETILIKGQPTEAMIVEGYFRPSRFESLIPLPYPVQPETCWVQIQPDGLTIQLSKELSFQPAKVCINLATDNSTAC